MRDWTYSELKEKVENDLDLQEDTIISATEMMGYCNEAIDEAEAEIHRLGLEDEYFLKSANLALVTGTSEYSLPSDIYANKIIEIVYNDGSRVYEIKRMRGSRRFTEMALITNSGDDEDYKYLIKNPNRPVSGDSTTGRKLVLYPASRETSSTNVTIWYIRNAARVTAVTDIIDIPEFANFILSFMKARCLGKEGDPRYAEEVAVLQQQRKLMIDTLTEMVPDAENTVEKDLTHYEEHN